MAAQQQLDIINAKKTQGLCTAQTSQIVYWMHRVVVQCDTPYNF